jgi:hypothetical protein
LIDLIVDQKHEEISALTLEQLCAYIGPEMEDILLAWRTKSPYKSSGSLQKDEQVYVSQIVERNYVEQCLTAFLNIWVVCGKEATLRLYHQYGIRHFQFFPHEILAQQARHQAPNPTKRFTLVIMPYHDHNMAFSNTITAITHMWVRTGETHEIVCTQAQNPREIRRRIFWACYNYGNDLNERKVDCIILGAHGTPESMEFGSPKKSGKITIETLKSVTRADVAFTNKMIHHDAKIAIISCSTGKEAAGFAQVAANVFNREVIAPDNEIVPSTTSFGIERDAHGHIGKLELRSGNPSVHTIHYKPTIQPQ